VGLLGSYPEAGRIVPEFRDSRLRELIRGRYRIVYEVGSDAVRILTIHGARILRDRPG
jgi:toxin ParE1/3/4